MRRALIVVDVQNDFCPGGSLAVADGDVVAARITKWLESAGDDYESVVATMDWHPAPGKRPGFAHFSITPDYVTSWPPHCVHGGVGAELHPNLVLPSDTVIVRKGQSDAAYSGFEGHDDTGASLAEILRRQRIDAVDIVGLATDYCVKATALDAARLGLSVRVLSTLTAGVLPGSTRDALDEMEAMGIEITSGTAASTSKMTLPRGSCRAQKCWCTPVLGGADGPGRSPLAVAPICAQG